MQDDLLKGVVAEDYLRKVQLVSEHFHGFDDDDVQTLARTMDVVTFKEGEQILQRGEPASWVGIVLEGDLDVPVARGLLPSAAVLAFLVGITCVFAPVAGSLFRLAAGRMPPAPPPVMLAAAPACSPCCLAPPAPFSFP